MNYISVIMFGQLRFNKSGNSKQLKPPMGFEPDITGFGGYGVILTNAQQDEHRKLPKTPLSSSQIVKQAIMFMYTMLESQNQPVLSNQGNVSGLIKQRGIGWDPNAQLTKGTVRLGEYIQSMGPDLQFCETERRIITAQNRNSYLSLEQVE